jgi:hypothetical protein
MSFFPTKVQLELVIPGDVKVELKKMTDALVSLSNSYSELVKRGK